MPKHQIRLEGEALQGRRVRAALLRDLLSIVIDGSQQAVRLRTQGRSTARGYTPAWLSAASEFLVEIKEGSTIVELEAPTLVASDPTSFSQHDLFPDINPELTSFDYFVDSLSGAIHPDSESPPVDRPMIQTFVRLEDLFERGVQSIRFEAEGTAATPVRLAVVERDIRGLAALKKQIPPPQQVRVAGKLDLIRHSDGTFYLELPGAERVRGIAQHDQLETLHGLWGKPVLVTGSAYFSPASKVLRVEAQIIRAASEKEEQLWGEVPEPLEAPIGQALLRVPQGPRSGLNAVIGKWPGDEDDETIWRALETMS